VPAREIRGFGRPVVRMRLNRDVLHLEVGAGKERVVRLSEDAPVVFEAREECAAVDEVELLREDPLVFGIFDFKLAVWRACFLGNAANEGVWNLECASYKAGWMGLRSVPMTLADGFCVAVYEGQSENPLCMV
jgi:hypothetical protein